MHDSQASKDLLDSTTTRELMESLSSETYPQARSISESVRRKINTLLHKAKPHAPRIAETTIENLKRRILPYLTESEVIDNYCKHVQEHAEEGRAFVATVDGKVAGCCILGEAGTNPKNRHTVEEIMRVSVLKKFRGQSLPGLKAGA